MQLAGRRITALNLRLPGHHTGIGVSGLPLSKLELFNFNANVHLASKSAFANLAILIVFLVLELGTVVPAILVLTHVYFDDALCRPALCAQLTAHGAFVVWALALGRLFWFFVLRTLESLHGQFDTVTLKTETVPAGGNLPGSHLLSQPLAKADKYVDFAIACFCALILVCFLWDTIESARDDTLGFEFDNADWQNWRRYLVHTLCYGLIVSYVLTALARNELKAVMDLHSGNSDAHDAEEEAAKKFEQLNLRILHRFCQLTNFIVVSGAVFLWGIMTPQEFDFLTGRDASCHGFRTKDHGTVMTMLWVYFSVFVFARFLVWYYQWRMAPFTWASINNNLPADNTEGLGKGERRQNVFVQWLAPKYTAQANSGNYTLTTISKPDLMQLLVPFFAVTVGPLAGKLDTKGKLLAVGGWILYFAVPVGMLVWYAFLERDFTNDVTNDELCPYDATVPQNQTHLYQTVKDSQFVSDFASDITMLLWFTGTLSFLDLFATFSTFVTACGASLSVFGQMYQ